jgi:hypothetical protein
VTAVKRLLLDVLKPHHPNVLDLATTIAALSSDYRVNVRVTAVDEKTESVELVVEGNAIDFDGVRAAIANFGGSIHSVDAVEVHGARTRSGTKAV